MDKSVIDELAKLAKMDMTDSEKAEIGANFSSILDYIDQIQSIETKEVSEKLGVVYNVMREDENANVGGQYTESILAEMPMKENGYLKVRKIM